MELNPTDPETFLKSDTELEMRENEVVKRMDDQERLAYDLLFEHRNVLSVGTPPCNNS